jgi:hypothetical protein
MDPLEEFFFVEEYYATNTAATTSSEGSSESDDRTDLSVRHFLYTRESCVTHIEQDTSCSSAVISEHHASRKEVRDAIAKARNEGRSKRKRDRPNPHQAKQRNRKGQKKGLTDHRGRRHRIRKDETVGESRMTLVMHEIHAYLDGEIVVYSWDWRRKYWKTADNVWQPCSEVDMSLFFTPNSDEGLLKVTIAVDAWPLDFERNGDCWEALDSASSLVVLPSEVVCSLVTEHRLEHIVSKG